MAESARVVIRERLFPDSHDALVDVLSKYPRQAGNQVVLAMSEACIGLWPITEADYHLSDGAESQTIKLTLSAEKYPKLFALYTALPRGVKGQAIINLLNRHQMLRQADPGKVNVALNEALLGRSSRGPEGSEALDKQETVQPGASVIDLATAVTSSPEAVSPLRRTEPVDADESPAEISPAISDVDMVDPLSDLPAMSWD